MSESNSLLKTQNFSIKLTEPSILSSSSLLPQVNCNLRLKDYVYGTAGAVAVGSVSFCKEGYKGAWDGAQHCGKKGWDIGTQYGEKLGSAVGKSAAVEIGRVAGTAIVITCESLAGTVGVSVPDVIKAGGHIGKQIGSGAGEYFEYVGGVAGYYAGGVVGAGLGGVGGAVIWGIKQGAYAFPGGVKTGWRKGIEYSRGGEKLN